MNFLTRWFHAATGYVSYRVPNADRIDIRRPKAQNWSQLNEVDWGNMAGQAITEQRLDKVSAFGVGRGYPMQQGNSQRRGVSVENKDYETWRTRVPHVYGGVWLTGTIGKIKQRAYLEAQFDKRAVIWDVDGTVFVISHYNPDTNTCYSLKHADVDEILEGTDFTTGHNPASRCWTPWSHLNPHEQAITLADYRGGDGLLTARDAPEAGSLLVLARGSWSFAQMMALGGECADRAEALATYGARVVDRSGYNDVNREDDHSKIGDDPRPPGLITQAGRQWGSTNLDRFHIELADMKVAM